MEETPLAPGATGLLSVDVGSGFSHRAGQSVVDELYSVMLTLSDVGPRGPQVLISPGIPPSATFVPILHRAELEEPAPKEVHVEPALEIPTTDVEDTVATEPSTDKTMDATECVEATTGECVCVFSSHSFWTSSSLDVPAGVTQEEGHTGFLIHLLPAVRALIFLARRIQPFLSLVDCEVARGQSTFFYIYFSTVLLLL